MTRDHTKLICDIGELAGLFADSSDLAAFLQKIVEMTAAHMQAAVCSIYLFDEQASELTLKATKGLKAEAVGTVTLKLGEGLTGLALKELRPICEKNASKTPGYRYFPEIGEELYESFLAVPIVRGQTRIGVLVVQNAQKNFFNEEDINVFRAITSQLANTIETAKVLMELTRREETPRPQALARDLKFIKGRVGSEGFAFAPAIVWDEKSLLEQVKAAGKKYVCGLEDFHRALEVSARQLEALQSQVEEKLSDVASLIFTAQMLMLKDKAFVDDIVRLINAGNDAAEAVVDVVERYARMFDSLPHAHLREKKQDVRDVGVRILENMIEDKARIPGYEGHILIARELYPSDVLKLSSQGVRGMILLSGGITSHLAILARSLRLPVIFIDDSCVLALSPGTPVLLDGQQGNVYICPSEDVVQTFREKEEGRLRWLKPGAVIPEETRTQDGTRIQLLANINLLGDLEVARAVGAEGIGLYRTEFPFMIRPDFPSEEEQFVIYQKLIAQMRDKEITFRTLDIGGDKVLSYYESEKEENPFLGMRSIRFSLRHQDIFLAQLRAILRAGVDADLRIMFPMISSLDQFCEAKALLEDAQKSLKERRVPRHTSPQVGMMVELPAALEIIDDFAQEADFLSVGTNDFIQYMLAVDRTNEKVADLYLPHHPSVLRGLKKVVDAATRHKKEVSVCGDMAHDEKYVGYLIGLGVRRLSMDSRYIPRVREAINGFSVDKLEKEMACLLRQRKVADIQQRMGSRAE